MAVTANSAIKKSFYITIGVLLALVTVSGVLALVGYGVAATHDDVISLTYDKRPSLNNDNAWGPYVISVTITAHYEGIATPAHTASCYDPYNSFWAGYKGATTQTGLDPLCRYTVAASPGESRIYGTVRIKNRLWMKSEVVSGNILRAKFGNNFTTITRLASEGKVLEPGQGVTNDFQASYGDDNAGAPALAANNSIYVLR